MSWNKPQPFSRIAVIFFSVFYSVYGFQTACAATGILALDDSAIVVKAPNHVFLDALARAGGRIVAVGEHGVITYSDDDGRTWNQATVPVDVTLTDVAFVNSLEGWAVGNSGVVLHTINGGKSWQLQLDGVQVNQLTLSAAQLAVDQKQNSVTIPLALRRANRFVAAGPNKPFLSVLPFADGRVFVFGSYRMVVKSTSGGREWADWSLRLEDPLSQDLYSAAADGTNIYVVGENGLVFISTDNGDNFLPAGGAGSATLFGVASLRGHVLLTYGVAGALFRSTDNAKTWQRVAVPESSNFSDAVILESGDILLAAESGSLYLSRDNGRSFQSAPILLPMALYGITEAVNGDIIAAGNRGIIKVPAKNL